MNPEQRRSVNVSLDCHARSPCRTCEIDSASPRFRGSLDQSCAHQVCAYQVQEAQYEGSGTAARGRRHQFLAALLYSQIAVLLNADLLQGLELALEFARVLPQSGHRL